MKKAKHALFFAVVSGIFLIGGFTAFFLFSGSSFLIGGRIERYEKALREFDALFEASQIENGLINISLIEKKIKELEKLNKNISVLQSELSLLKRKRKLVKYINSYNASYKQELDAAVKKYPVTVQLLALSIEDEIKNGIKSVDAALKINSAYKTNKQYEAPVEIFLSGAAELINEKEREYLLVDSALLDILSQTDGRKKDTETIFFPLQLQTAKALNTFRFAAEYAYDTDAFALSSRLFAALPGPDSLERAGDAQYLSGDTDGARELWFLADDDTSLYNYAVFSNNESEKKAVLEKIVKREGDNLNKKAFVPAFTLYTRLFNDERAAAFLASSSDTAKEPLLDLELWRRTEKNYPPDRSIAEMWRIIGRHKTSVEIQTYAAWYFAYLRRYDELDLLLKNARLPSVEFDVELTQLVYWETFLAARSSDNAEAIKKLEAYSNSKAQTWFAEANIGLYLEAGRSFAAAEQRYRNALVRAELPRDKAHIIERIAGCVTAQGRSNEARVLLEEALLLDPKNVRVRSELSR